MTLATGDPYRLDHLVTWANGMAAVRLELDEGNQFAANHPAAHVLPTVLAVPEAEGSTGRDLLEALSAGYEVAVRVARGIRLRQAVHPFGTAMICGAAMGVARLWGLSPADATRGATVRNAVTGACAASAVVAADLAATGTGPDPAALDIVFGQILGTAYDASFLDLELGEQRYLTRNYFKLHACSRWNHAAIEATAALQVAHGLTPEQVEEVEEVEVATYDPAIRLCNPEPANGFAGKHSIPYSVAARLRYGANGLEQYTDHAVGDPAVRALARRVRVVEDPGYTRAAPGVRAARVTVRLRDGGTHTAVEDRLPGGFDRPYPAAALAAKHHELLRRTLPESTAASLLDWCLGLPVADSLGELQDILGPAA